MGRVLHLKEEVESIDEDEILAASETDLCTRFTSAYAVELPTLLEDSTDALRPREIDIDVSGDPSRHRFHDGNRPYTVKGTCFTFCVPFKGTADIFNYQPRQFYRGRYPKAMVQGNELHFSYESADLNKEKVKVDFGKDLGLVTAYLKFGEAQVREYNQNLSDNVETIIANRRKHLLDARDVLAHIGVPIRERTNVPKVFTPPAVRKKIRTAPRIQKVASFESEPWLDDAIYNNILKMIQDMVLVMEKSKKTFAQMKEEDLRNILLVVLNAHFEGGATGETFNSEGKTDILVNDKGKNVFIAECKFWTGPKSLTKAIDQLLGYVCWRDTKTAIILFNRRKDFSAVLEKIPGTVQAHAMHKKPLGVTEDSNFRYLFRHKDDPNRELFLSVLAFEIPE